MFLELFGKKEQKLNIENINSIIKSNNLMQQHWSDTTLETFFRQIGVAGHISYPYEGLQIICLRAMCIIMYVEKNYKHLILISPNLMKHYAYNFIDEMNVKFYLYWDNDEMTILMSKDRVLKCFNENLDIINFDRSIEAEQYYISDYNTFIVPYFDKHHITETIKKKIVGTITGVAT